MMNNKGQMFLIGMGIAFLLLMVGISVAQILKGDIDTTLSSDGLDCDNAAITDGTKLTCLGFYLLNPYFIGLVILSTIMIVIGIKK